jgi:hypothetical protein
MDRALLFYQTLATVSLTLLGLWFAVLQLAHPDWRADHRRRPVLHIALHFLAPGRRA